MGSRLEANSTAVRKRIEKHKFEDEEGEEYEPSKFGGFGDYFRRKKIKLQNLDAEIRSSAQEYPPIFRGVVAHVNGYTQPSLNDLHTMIVSHGGGFMQYLDGKTTVTHIIASNLTPKKRVEFSKYRIVKPAWVVDSIKAGKLLPWDAYRVVDEGIGQRVLGFDNGNIVSQANNNQSGYKDQTDTSWYTKQVEDIANQINTHEADSLFPKTQIPTTNSIKSSSRDESTRLDNTRKGCEDDVFKPNRKALSPSKLPNGPDEAEAAAKGSMVANESLGLEADHDTLPAVCKSPAESGSDIQSVSADYSSDNVSQCMSDQPPVSPTVELAPVEEEISLDKDPSDFDAAKQVLHSSPQVPHVLGMNSAANAQNTLIAGHNIENMTSEEHNALLLTDPKVWKSTVVNPGFLKQYYEESRLHHLSAWKAALKTQLQALAAEKSASQKAREKRAPGTRRYVLHVDFDSFFAAVSLKQFPHYIDKPVVVAHGNGSGAEIASCNYPARKFGIKNGMWMKHAQKLCPELKVLPYDFKAYEDASRNFYGAIIGTGGIVQSVSVDEALVDVSAQCIAAGGHHGKGIQEGSIWREQAEADTIAQNLRDQIKEKTGCAVSIGIGGNILLAKVALRKAKPSGQYHVKPEGVLDFLGELTMQDLPGVAYSIGGKLEEIGVKYVKDVRQLSREKMISVLGPKTGEKIWDYSRGIDHAEVGYQVVRKSVSAEVNWGIRFVTQGQVDEFIQCLCDELHKRLLNEGVKGRQLTMKIMRRAADAPLDPPKHLGHGKCDTFNKSVALGVATYDAAVLGREALSILKGFGFSPGELRGLGVQMQKLEPIKGGAGNPFESSQKRLQFKTSTPRKPTIPPNDSAVDDIDSPKKPKQPPPIHAAAAFARKVSPSGKPHEPLNTLGTQFVLPSQVDSEVLKELPKDIKSKFLPKEPLPEVQQERDNSPATRSRSTSPDPPPDVLPSHSQIDQGTLDALPADVRTEILAYYAKSPHKVHNQAILPQSPRKARTIRLPKKLTTPTKKRGRPVGGGGSKQSASAFPTLTQSNFVANARGVTSRAATEDGADGYTTDEMPAEFLSALPEDIKREVLAQARRDRLQKKGGIDLTASKKKRAPAEMGPMEQRTLTLPPRPPKPTFTAQRLTHLPELREAMTAWVEEFRDEGPYEEDVDALVQYLKRVIAEEKDMNKAFAVGKWLKWVIDESDDREARGWDSALKKVEEGVQEAVTARGLGRVEF